MKKLTLLLCLSLVGLALAQPAGMPAGQTAVTAAAGTLQPKLEPWLTIDVKDFGKIVVELFPDDAPLNVKNVETLAAEGFYNGLTFHRVMDGFMIQGGDPTGTGAGGPEYTVPAEIKLSNVRGAMAMARTPDEVNPERASSSCQFYIVQKDAQFLDGAYTVIGMTRAGMDVVDRIAVVQRDDANKPLTPVIMQKVTVEMREPYKEPPLPNVMTIDFKGFGTVKVELYSADARANVKSVTAMAGTGMYDSTTIREVVAGKYVQAGDKNSETGCCGGCQLTPVEYKHKLTKGAVAVGTASDLKIPRAACVFFFCLSDQPGLDSVGYTVIGKVVEGMAVLEKIGKVKVDAERKPRSPILIRKVFAEYVQPQN